MKNLLVSIILFLSMVCFMFYSNNELIMLCDDIIILCENVENAISSDDENSYIKESKKLKDKLQNSSTILSAYINHADIDIIYTESSKLHEYLKLNSKDNALASLVFIKNSTMIIKNLQNVSLRNVF